MTTCCLLLFIASTVSYHAVNVYFLNLLVVNKICKLNISESSEARHSEINGEKFFILTPPSHLMKRNLSLDSRVKGTQLCPLNAMCESTSNHGPTHKWRLKSHIN